MTTKKSPAKDKARSKKMKLRKQTIRDLNVGDKSSKVKGGSMIGCQRPTGGIR